MWAGHDGEGEEVVEVRCGRWWKQVGGGGGDEVVEVVEVGEEWRWRWVRWGEVVGVRCGRWWK